jgi:hypothetical protein
MQLPFSLEEFLSIFRAYNEAVGIAPLLLAALATALIALAHSEFPWRHTIIAIGMASLWAWSGIVYHWTFVTSINPAATLFAALFVIQALLILLNRNRVTLSPQFSDNKWAGWAFIIYALLIYPIAGSLLGHEYPSEPTFGAPCPVVLYFIGMMFWSVPRIHPVSIVIPVLWAIIGGSAALKLGMTEDLALLAGATFLIYHVVTHGHVRFTHRVRADT